MNFSASVSDRTKLANGSPQPDASNIVGLGFITISSKGIRWNSSGSLIVRGSRNSVDPDVKL